MAEFITELNPEHAIFGNKLEGIRDHASVPLHGTIAIKGFNCKVAVCGDYLCIQLAQQYFGILILHGKINDSLSGKRAIIEPAIGYKPAKKFRKGGKHNPKFTLKRGDDCPAICYADTIQAIKVKLAQ